ncbi:stalk domain-containing protein [Paenibacillus ginsengarvi]|uniref:Copper amine oxidase N-terminal domain-containing protein n=1 Tax=Paenibacillus ginsengarvi TaxID=400777 RepID=A0A3B0BQC6_9BACL|nr:stalk domain-containing protein [Paenibacillus ginsengarvi]RKN75062.1 copper amine oxidase N-terminal domain-containing protein [Paenibacillus ginsengarvi]
MSSRGPKKWAVFALFFALIVGSVTSASGAGTSVSTSTMEIWLKLDEPVAYIDGKKMELETPGVLKDGNTRYVPIKFLGDQMGIDVKFNAKTKRTEIGTPRAKIEVDAENKAVYINGVYLVFDSVARMFNDKLMVKESWLFDFLGAKYTFNAEQKRLEITYVKKPPSRVDEKGNSRPVARFTFGKPVYKIGEPVQYIDLSYDPDAEGLVYEWEGKEEAFFYPGKYLVKLKVKDGGGLVSDVYSRYIEVTKDVMYDSPMDFKLHTYPLQSLIKTNWTEVYAYFNDLPAFDKKVTEDRSRKLLVSDSPETFEEKGILYTDTVNGKARLYADHINGMKEKVQFVIMATNKGSKPVTVKTTNKGEVYPSIYANLIGHEASVEFLLGDKRDDDLIVPPGQSRLYVQMPDFLPGQGVNVIYDVETDGPVEFAFMAMDASIETPISTYPLLYKQLPRDQHIRGTFPITEKRWDIDASSFERTTRLIFGDNEYDTWQTGYDPTTKMEVTDDGNYGVVYKIHSDKPRKMAILLQARGGPFKGPFKINGEFVLAPPSGVITAFESVQILARTTGTEPSLDIEFTPPAGSAFPMNLIFYPLD